jgi:hypothetical protein
VTATVQVKANGYTDAAGNNGSASATVPITINTTLPSLAHHQQRRRAQERDTATLTFTFSTPPTGFTAATSASNGTLSGFAATANPLVYTAVFTPNANLGAGVANISVGAGTYTDAFGNSGGGASGPAISIDTLAPTVAITSNVAAVKAGETATVTFTFSERRWLYRRRRRHHRRHAERIDGDANPLVYTGVHADRRHPGTSASITIASGAFTDTAGNAASAAAPPISIDTLPPAAVGSTVTFSADNGSSATT